MGVETEAGRPPRMPVTLVVPCFNEEPVVPGLANILHRTSERLGTRYALRVVLVDDGSTDGTWRALREQFTGLDHVRLVQHPRNRGVAAAILRGIEEAETEVVCSIDSDGSYDPHELERMIPMLADADLVTASPYHPRGAVRNVAPWRLGLSRAASGLYRLVLGRPLATYTSCFRVYRRSVVLGLPLREPGFVGIAELAARLALAGHIIAECPVTLQARRLGRSKMKIARTVLGHLRLLGRLAMTRAWRAGRPRRHIPRGPRTPLARSRPRSATSAREPQEIS